ncbi:MAG: peptidylprolyl isomerase [Candidatus Aenigmarchaeota archaeon]|nr:peptidylprolyl isomerase [Candidatus Aenigmarchaeota archaeon]
MSAKKPSREPASQGRSSGRPVQAGDRIQVEYEGKLEDGKVFDRSAAHGKPLEFEVGKGQVIPGFEQAVVGMRPGQTTTVQIPPKEAYGMPKPELQRELPRSRLPKDREPEVGMMLLMGLPDGRQLPVRITKVSPAAVTLDLNHPLAGHILTFTITIASILADGHAKK